VIAQGGNFKRSQGRFGAEKREVTVPIGRADLLGSKISEGEVFFYRPEEGGEEGSCSMGQSRKCYLLQVGEGKIEEEIQGYRKAGLAEPGRVFFFGGGFGFFLVRHLGCFASQ